MRSMTHIALFYSRVHGPHITHKALHTSMRITTYLRKIGHSPHVEGGDARAPPQQSHEAFVGNLLAPLESQRLQPPAVCAQGLQ